MKSVLAAACALTFLSIGTNAPAPEAFLEHARSRAGSLAIASYATADTVQRLSADDALRAQAIDTVRRLGLTAMYLEVYRGGTVVSVEALTRVRDFFAAEGLEVIGGIATVPGGDFGVAQEGPLTWFNWQNEKTQRDLRAVMAAVAPIFDTFIIDDFYCTGDVSAESAAARGDRSWGDYRRDLMIELADPVFLAPARAANPDITMVLKYPQWYDRFHLFGYDTAELPHLFDVIWVGTETRGARTQRFGFVQPYEGFINYRWLADVSGDRIGGAWFDHGDCADFDFLDQAYMSVLAGARELVLFNFLNLMEGHPDHERFVSEFDRLADLAVHITNHPVVGATAYKPPNSDPGGDMYLMDFIGMLGVSLVPSSRFPADAPVIVLPTQAAADPDIASLTAAAAEKGTPLVFTTGFLDAADDPRLYALAGIAPSLRMEKMLGQLVDSDGKAIAIVHGLDLAARIDCAGADVLVTARYHEVDVPYLTRHDRGRAPVYVLNTRTFDQADFDAVGEVLLCPRPLGILELPAWAVQSVRDAFHSGLGIQFEAPARVSCQMLADGSFVVQNNDDTAIDYALHTPEWPAAYDVFAGESVSVSNSAVHGAIPARGRVWLTRRPW